MTLEAEDAINIYAPISGRVTRLLVASDRA
jgi:hypothetical protein